MTEIIYLHEEDDWAALRDRLRRAQDPRVLLVLDWEAGFPLRPLDVQLVRREAERFGLTVAFVSRDPERRSLIRSGGLVAFASIARAEATPEWASAEDVLPDPPRPAWWEEPIRIWPPPGRALPSWARRVGLGVRVLIFVATIILLVGSAYVVVPRATITLVPAGEMLQVVTPVSVSLDAETVDTTASLIPARRVGDYFEGYLEVETTGEAAFSSGRATGEVLFTNLLDQDVPIPSGTVVRTSAGGFPVRFVTAQDAVVPPLGQVPVPIEAVDAGPAGNVGVNQINRIEGFLAFSLRVTNPTPTVGGATQEARAVSQADMDRARELLTVQLLDEAYQGLQVYLEPTEFMPYQSLEVQASEVAYNRFLNERADTVGLHMRLLITGMAADWDNAKAVAYAALTRRVPQGYRLVAASFESGEVAEEPIGSGDLTIFVTAIGYAAADISPQEVRELTLGERVQEAVERLADQMPLSEPARIRVWPDWLERVPLLPLRVDVQVLPEG